jgi:hypothetical protein
MISTRSLEFVIDPVVSLTLAKWETVSGPFGGYLNARTQALAEIQPDISRRAKWLLPCRVPPCIRHRPFGIAGGWGISRRREMEATYLPGVLGALESL